MVTQKQYNEALEQTEAANEVIRQYHSEKDEKFKERLKNKPVFKDRELTYSMDQLCPCGHGLAYPRGCGPGHYWDCSAILKGLADEKITHTGQLPFAYYSIKSETKDRTTRGVCIPRPE